MVRVIFTIFIGFMFVIGTGLSAQAGGKGLKLQQELDMAAADDPIPVILTLVGTIDLKKHKQRRKEIRKEKRRLKQLKAEQRSALIKELKAKSDPGLKSLKKFLKKHGVKNKDMKLLWMINSMAVTVPARLVNELEARPEVESLKLDVKVASPGGTSGAGSSPIEWNIDAIKAHELWAQGHDGSGIVIASMDTGVDYNHPDIAPKWRGGSNSWYDPNGEHAVPYDKTGHGTWVMGLMVGGDTGGSAIGVAPGAQWISVKIFNDSGAASLSSIHMGFQWLLDPDGDPDVDDAPDIINNSWYLGNTVDQCDDEFQQDIDTLKAAGIALVFSAGNTGPYTDSSVSPANNYGNLAIGAMGAWNEYQYVSGSSARGPSACDGSMYPQIVAPGVDVITADRTLGGVFPDSYISVSGTSFAAPHVSAAMALLMSVNPNLPPSELETALQLSAWDIDPVGLDDDSGYGLIDVMAAYQTLSNEPAAPVTADDGYDVIESNTLNVAAPGLLSNDSDANGDPLTALLDSPSSSGSVTLYSNGSFDYTPNAGYTGTDSFTYIATDGTMDSENATVTITVNPILVNDPPLANNDSTSTDEDAAVDIDVLANDTDGEGDLLSVSTVTQGAHGTVDNNGGSVSYTPDPGFSGTDSFDYTASDGLLNSNQATVTIDVIPAAINTPPVAVKNVKSTKKNKTKTFNIVANDYDSDGFIDPATVVITKLPSIGTAVSNGDGTVTYTPQTDFTGRVVFKYTVNDDDGATSNVAKVVMKVKP